MSADDPTPAPPAAPPLVPMSADQVTIVILNWNRGEETVACLVSLRQADLGGASILVVDNGSHDGSAALLRRHDPTLHLIELPENRGFAGGANAGIRAALDRGAAGVLLLNNDTRVAADFLRPLLDAINSSPWAGAAASAIVRLDRPEMLDVAYGEVFFEQRHVVHILGVNALPGEGFDRRQSVQVTFGCSLLLKAEALRRIGLFEEAYFAYHEDVDWCIRARKAGYELFYEPFSRVFHKGSGSTAALADRPVEAAASIAAGGGDDALPNAEPLPWNPIRTYLGIRNTLRLLHRHANKKQRIAFARACLRELPLEFSALLMNEAGRMKLGHWSWDRFARGYFVDRHPRLARHPAGPVRWALLALYWPGDVLWCLPRDAWRAWRGKRFVEFAEYLRGLRDGVLDRRLPLRRLGLR